MSPRRVRIQKVVDHRTEQLEKTVSELADSRAKELEALKAVEQQREKVREALEQRDRLTGGEASVDNWLLADNWLKAQNALEQLALRRAAGAKAAVEAARDQVVQ